MSPIVLDLELSLFFKYPWRDGELLVASGDVIIDFNTVDGQPLRKSLAEGQLSFDLYLDFLVASLGSLDEASYLARMAGQSGASESAQRIVYHCHN